MFYTALKIIKNNLDEITSVINSFKEGNRVKTIKTMTYGIIGIKPQIVKAKIAGTKLYVKFQDGRELYIPKKIFPFLKGKTGKVYIADSETIIFDNADEVIHVSELLGRYEDYKYSFA